MKAKRAKLDAMTGCPSGNPRAPFGPVKDGKYTKFGRVIDETRKGWQRPDLPQINPVADDIVFQQVDTDQYYGQTDMRFYPAGTAQGCERPIIRMFGVTKGGNSITAHVHGFQPYFFVKADQVTELNISDGSFEKKLNSAASQKTKGMGAQQGGCVEKVEWVMRQTLMNYQAEKAVPFLKITMVAPHMVSAARSVFEGCGQMTYESNVVFPLRFMIDHDLAGGQWAVVPKGSYQIRSAREQMTTAQLEIDIHHDRIIAKVATCPAQIVLEDNVGACID